jgi:hypothetical protein
MFNLRYHHIYDGKLGATVLTMEPHRRTILGQSYENFYSKFKDFKPLSVWFPYTAFVVQYKAVAKGFIYHGYHGHDLRVLFNNKPFTSIYDHCYSSVTEHNDVEGFSCTPHKWDGSVFPNVRLLLGTVLNLWFQSGHVLICRSNEEFVDRWPKLSAEEVLRSKFYPASPISRYVTGPIKQWMNCPIKKLPTKPIYT